MRAIAPICLLALVLTGCASGGDNQGRTTPKPDPADLRVKLAALAVDGCVTKPDQQAPKDCQKYITQLASTAGMVRRHAETDAALTEQVTTLEGGLADYQKQGCVTVANLDTPCTQTLVSIAGSLKTITAKLDNPTN